MEISVNKINNKLGGDNNNYIEIREKYSTNETWMGEERKKGKQELIYVTCVLILFMVFC